VILVIRFLVVRFIAVCLMVSRLIIGFILAVTCLQAVADQRSLAVFGHTSPERAPLIFQDWKNQQIKETQQALTEVTGQKKSSNDLSQKAAKVLVATQLLSLQRIKVSGVKAGRLKQRRKMRSINESIQYAHDLGLEEYITVYLVNFREDIQALTSLVEKLSTQETAQLIQSLMREREKRATTERAGAIPATLPLHK